MIDYIRLADEVVASNSMSSYKKLEAFIIDVNNIDAILTAVSHSDNLLFAVSEIMSKSLLNRQFSLIRETRSEEDLNNQKEREIDQLKIYGNIVMTILEILKKKNLETYIIKSALNLISVCLKCALQLSTQWAYTKDFFQVLLPNFKLNPQFINNFSQSITIIQPSQQFPDNTTYLLAIKTLISLLQYVSTGAYYTNYYQYRRNIYSFRNSHLAVLLNIAIQYCKLFFKLPNVSPQYLRQTIILLYSIVDYPYTLNLHEFEIDEEDNLTGNSTEIYFPNYFRNVLNDRQFLMKVTEYYLGIMAVMPTLAELDQIREVGQTHHQKKSYDQQLEMLNYLVRFLGRIICASNYCFNSQAERKKFRNLGIEISIALIDSLKIYQTYYLSQLCQIFNKILSTYTSSDYSQLKQTFIQKVLTFAVVVVSNSQIVLQDGKKNPIAKIFQLLSLCCDETKDTGYFQEVRTFSEQILEKTYARFLSNQETFKVMAQFGTGRKAQIQVFEELYENIPKVFKQNQDRNLELLQRLDNAQLNASAQTFWLHLCSQLLPNHQANQQQTAIILKYFQWAKTGRSMASLHYIHTMMKQILTQIQDGISTTSLWKFISQLTNQSFYSFLLYIIKICMQNFNHPQQDLLDYSLQILKQIYSKLKKYDNPYFNDFYQIIKEFLNNLESTVFSQPKYYKKRVDLFNVISLLWINGNNMTSYDYIYEIYGLLRGTLMKENGIQGLLKYFYDLRGLLEPVEYYEAFQVLAEISLKDLQQIIPQYITNQTIFQDKTFLKAFCNLAYSFSADTSRRLTSQTHSDLPYRINQLFYPYLLNIFHYQWPKKVINLWVKLIPLNPLKQLLPISKEMKSRKNKSEYTLLLREYFQNLHRVSNLDTMYEFIEDNVEFMTYWWEEVITRGTKPKVGLKGIAQARIWNTKRQKEAFAKMVYMVGGYDGVYWDVGGYKTQKDFVTAFSEYYT